MTSAFIRAVVHCLGSAQASRGLSAAYAPAMLGRLQDRRGHANLRSRALAGLVVLGMVVLTAPLVVLPVLHWLAGMF